MKIWKFGLYLAGMQDLMMPKGAKLLSVQTQGDLPRVWALVDEYAELERRTFVTYGTGHPMPDDPGVYVGTYLTYGEDLVFHVFEVTQATAQ